MLTAPDLVAMILRGASFVADFQAAGIALFLVLFGGRLTRSKTAIRKLGAGAAMAGLVLTLAHFLAEPARMAGLMSGVFDASLYALLLSTNVAVAAAVRILGLLLLVPGLRSASQHGDGVALIGAMLVVFSFALVGHTSAHDLRWVLIVLLLSHMFIVTLWYGALLPLLLVSKQESLATTSSTIDLFSRVAAWAVPVIFIAGLGMSVLLLESLANLWTPYGKSVLLKVTGFALLMVLATLNKYRFGPAIAGGRAASLTAFHRTLVAEWCLITVILAITAVMTGLFSPTH